MSIIGGSVIVLLNLQQSIALVYTEGINSARSVCLTAY